MIRLAAALIFAALVIAALLLTEHRPPNANLPVVNAAVPMFEQRPAWRLYTTCPVDHRNVPILEERTA